MRQIIALGLYQSHKKYREQGAYCSIQRRQITLKPVRTSASFFAPQVNKEPHAVPSRDEVMLFSMVYNGIF